MGTVTWKKAKVGIDGDEVYEAEIMDGVRWNGFVCPRFTREVTEQVVRDIEAQNAKLIADGHDVQDTTRFGWDGDVLTTTDGGDGSDGWTDTYEPDADGMYHLGSHSWVWSEIKSA